jgi:hypothetical protein
MNRQIDVETVVHRWLAEGPTEVPDAVLHAAMAEVAGTPRARRGTRDTRRWRSPIASWAAARLTVLAVLAVAFFVVIVGPDAPGLPGAAPGSAPAASPTPTPNPSWCPTVSPAPSPRPPTAPVTLGCGGRFRTQAFRPTVDFSLDRGIWMTTLDSEAQLDLSAGPGRWLHIARLDNLVREPCASPDAGDPVVEAWRPPLGQAARDLHDRLARITGLELQPLEAASVAGLAAERFEVHVSADPTSACSMGPAVSDTGIPSGPLRLAPGSAASVTLVELDGQVMSFWVVAEDAPSLSALKGEGDAVIETVSFPS